MENKEISCYILIVIKLLKTKENFNKPPVTRTPVLNQLSLNTMWMSSKFLDDKINYVISLYLFNCCSHIKLEIHVFLIQLLVRDV